MSMDTSSHSEHMPPIRNPHIEPKKENFIVETIKFIVLALVIVLPIRLWIAQPFVVSGASMDPTFGNGQYLIVDELSYRFQNPDRGDVIVFEPPIDPERYYIKRIIGLPGETIEIRDNSVIIKNNEYPEGFVLSEPFVYAGNEKVDNLSLTLKKDQYFVMGDNRKASSDSRVWGPITKKAIVGKPAARLFPIETISVYPGKVTYSN